MGKINSRQKGAQGEREWSRFLTERGFPSIRGRQFSGSSDSPDVQHLTIKGIHSEVKRVQALNIDAAMSQSEADASDNVPIVAHRKNGKHWLVTLKAEEFVLFFLPGFIAQFSDPMVRLEAMVNMMHKVNAIQVKKDS